VGRVRVIAEGRGSGMQLAGHARSRCIHLRDQFQAQRRRVIGELPGRHSRFLARSRPARATAAITSRANAAARGDTDDGRQLAI
jgi:hypothetical protein